MNGMGGETNRDEQAAATVVEIESGSDEELEWRGDWMSRMFGWTLGYNRDPGTYETWLTANGVRLV